MNYTIACGYWYGDTCKKKLKLTTHIHYKLPWDCRLKAIEKIAKDKNVSCEKMCSIIYSISVAKDKEEKNFLYPQFFFFYCLNENWHHIGRLSKIKKNGLL